MKMPKVKNVPYDDLRDLGGYIKAERKKCGLTQQELADQTGVGFRHIQNIEKGLINPSYEVLLPIVRRLGMSGDILFNQEMPKIEEESRHLLNKLAVCTDDERKFILKTVDFMVEEFLRKR